MEGVPADIGSWSVVRVFQEGDRLLNQHFSVFRPFILLFILPGALIKTLYLQFLFALQFDSPDAESRSTLTLLAFSLVSVLPRVFNDVGAAMFFRFLTKTVYVTDCSASPCGTENLRDSVTLAFFVRDIETENPVLRTTTTENSLYERVRLTSKGKKLKACAVVVASVVVCIVVSSGGLHFTPVAIAERGLPPWTIFLFTVLITLLSTATTTYLILVNLVLFIWICSPRTGILK